VISDLGVELPREIHQDDRHSANLQLLDLLGSQHAFIKGYCLGDIIDSEMTVIEPILHGGLSCSHALLLSGVNTQLATKYKPAIAH
jgi:hypothetical protein